MTCIVEAFTGCPDEISGTLVTFDVVETFRMSVCGEIPGCELHKMDACEELGEFCAVRECKLTLLDACPAVSEGPFSEVVSAMREGYEDRC